MNITTAPHRTTRILLLGAGLVTACSLAVGVGALSAEAAPLATASSATASSAGGTVALTTAAKTGALPRLAYTRAHLRDLVGKLPKSLKTDLKALKGDTPTQRRSAVQAIEKKAVDGGYGTTVQSAVKRAIAVWDAAPAALKTDVTSLKGMSKTQRKAELLVIEKKALSGAYGSSVEAYAKQLQANVKSHVKTSSTTVA